MAKNIIVAADETIICPGCNKKFSLHLGISQQTIEKYESEYLATFAAQKKELEKEITAEAERRAAKAFTQRIDALKDELEQSRQTIDTTKESLARAQAEARVKAVAEFESEKRSLAEELAEKDKKLQEFKDHELQLRAEKRQLEDAKHNLELDVARRVEEERKKLQHQIVASEGEKFKLRESELKKQIDDALKANEDLRKKLEQGSQQRQGEVLELELENLLSGAFRHDRIEEVKKGQRGADVLQCVCSANGQVCGTIIWEAKRAENWSDKWLTKLKDDQLEAKADIPVLVTTAMPKASNEPFCIIEGVWVVAPHVMRPVAETLRILLIEAHRLKLVNTGRNEKMELLYNYLSSTQFAQKIRTMLESVASMRADLEAEKRAMQRIWSKRQAQLERVSNSMSGVVGELQAIAHDSLPQLEAIDVLALPKVSEDDLSNL